MFQFSIGDATARCLCLFAGSPGVSILHWRCGGRGRRRPAALPGRPFQFSIGDAAVLAPVEAERVLGFQFSIGDAQHIHLAHQADPAGVSILHWRCQIGEIKGCGYVLFQFSIGDASLPYTRGRPASRTGCFNSPLEMPTSYWHLRAGATQRFSFNSPLEMRQGDMAEVLKLLEKVVSILHWRCDAVYRGEELGRLRQAGFNSPLEMQNDVEGCDLSRGGSGFNSPLEMQTSGRSSRSPARSRRREVSVSILHWRCIEKLEHMPSPS